MINSTILHYKSTCTQVGVAYIECAVPERTDFSITASVEPQGTHLLRTKGSRTMTKLALITLHVIKVNIKKMRTNSHYAKVKNISGKLLGTS